MVKKIFLILGIILVSTYAKAQVYNINEAETLAKKENKLILIKFSGSDWCGPCYQPGSTCQSFHVLAYLLQR